MITRVSQVASTAALAALVAIVLVAPQAHAASVNTWQQLRDAVAAGGAVTVGADISGPGVTISTQVPTTIDLAGHTVSLAGNPAVRLDATAQLTVTDSVGGGVLDARTAATPRLTHSAVIGSNAGEGTRAGSLVVDGAVVRAVSVSGEDSLLLEGAAVGGGRDTGGGTVTVVSGELIADASAGYQGAGIGGGYRGSGGTLTVLGGTVTATGSPFGAGIGSGMRGATSGTLTVSGGTVNATAGTWSAGIGGGDSASGGTVSVTGGAVSAQGQGWGAGIGGGRGGAGGTVAVSGGTVEATGHAGAASIGGGSTAGVTSDGPVAGGRVTISGGRVEAMATGDSNTFGAGDDAASAAQPGEVEIIGSLTPDSASTVYGPSPSPLSTSAGTRTLRVATTVHPGDVAMGTTVIAEVFAVAYDAKGGTPQPATALVSLGDKASMPAAPTRSGHVFAGWYDGDQEFDFDLPITGPKTLTALWETPLHRVTYDSAGGSAVAAEYVRHGAMLITQPPETTRPGHDFAGWTYQGQPYETMSLTIVEPITIVATWTPRVYEVSFDSAGGTAVGVQTVEHGTRASKPSSPTREGYEFAGWKRGSQRFDFGSAITSDLTLTATWRQASPAGSGPQPTAPVRLVDVSSDPDSRHHTPFHREISWLASTGITKGWNVGGGRYEFRPREEISREAMAAFMYRYAGSPAVDLPARSPFTDVTPSSTHFYTEIIWMSQQGISTGWSVNGSKEFRPKDAITRDAMAAFMYRFAGDPDTTAPARSPFSDVTPRTQFYREITWLASTGISTGWGVAGGKREYRPFDQISREAMAAFLYRFNRL